MTMLRSFSWGVLACALIYGGPPHPGSPFDIVIRLLGNLAGVAEAVPTLHYFDVRGRGEAIRLAFADMNITYEEVSFTGEQWGKFKPDGLKAKYIAAGQLAFGQVPLLTHCIKGPNEPCVEIAQSHSILRYIGRMYNADYRFASFDRLAAIDVAADGTEDVRKPLSTIKYSEDSDEVKHERYTKWYTDEGAAPMWFGYFEKLVAASSTPYLAGTTTPSHADYLLLDTMDYHEVLEPALANELFSAQRLPALVEWRATMRARPGIAAYLASPRRRAA